MKTEVDVKEFKIYTHTYNQLPVLREMRADQLNKLINNKVKINNLRKSIPCYSVYVNENDYFLNDIKLKLNDIGFTPKQTISLFGISEYSIAYKENIENNPYFVILEDPYWFNFNPLHLERDSMGIQYDFLNEYNRKERNLHNIAIGRKSLEIDDYNYHNIRIGISYKLRQDMNHCVDFLIHLILFLTNKERRIKCAG